MSDDKKTKFRGAVLDATMSTIPEILTEEDTIPPISKETFDRIYALPTVPACRWSVDVAKDCHKTCEPGPDNAHGENLVLLPGEDEYLRKRLKENGLEYKWGNTPPVVVRLKESCPYHEKGVCSIHDHRPFTCRSYPLRCHKTGEMSLAVFFALGCPASLPSADDLTTRPTYRAWIGAWKALLPHLDDKWWTSFTRACPAGFKHIGDIIDPSEEGVPLHMLRKYATSGCADCDGEGLNCSGVCSCITNDDRVNMLREFKQSQKRFTT